jgi:hypothetical protein
MKKLFSILMLMIIGLSGTAYAEDFQINKGWNLVSFYLADELTKGLKEEYTNVYFFNVYNKNYISYSELVSSEELINNLFSFYGSEGDEDPYFSFTPVWFYSKEKKIVSNEMYNNEVSNVLEELDLGNVEFKLTKGWNLITINQNMLDINMNEFISESCGLNKVYFFNPETQTWLNIPIHEEFSEKELGYGIAIKIENDCQLGYEEEISAPPAIPNN